MTIEFTNAHLKKPSIKPQAEFWLIRVEVVHTLAIKGYNKYDYVSTDDAHLYNWFVPFQYRDTMTKNMLEKMIHTDTIGSYLGN